MKCPFLGMDPYLERTEIFPDFHDALIYNIRVALHPLVRPKYAALGQDRLFVVQSDRPRYPDVAVVRTPSPLPSTQHGTAVVEADAPAVFEIWREEIRQPYLTIVEPAMGNRIVTAIEVLSPSNKEPGPGRDSFLEKRDEFWQSGVNLIEIDLLRSGERTVPLSSKQLKDLGTFRHLVAVTRRTPSRHEVYAFPLEHRLPRIAIPLGKDDKDVVLDLQAVFARCWDEGPYPDVLRYDGPPPGKLSEEELKWCAEKLKEFAAASNGQDSEQR